MKKDDFWDNPILVFLATFTILFIFFLYIGFFQAEWFDNNPTKDVCLLIFSMPALLATYLSGGIYLEQENIKRIVPEILEKEYLFIKTDF
tara:strand:- start:282 stop:551 length:270 start_codon:yes stop_codon:yes gene_type:complete